MKTTESKGYTIIYYPVEDNGRPRVAGRFKTVDEKNQFLSEIYNIDSGWKPEELATLMTKDGYNYSLEMEEQKC